MSTSTENTKYIATFINIIVILTPDLTVPEGTWWEAISPEDKEFGGTSKHWAGSWGGRWWRRAYHQRQQDVESFPWDKPLIPKMTLIRSRRREVSVFFKSIAIWTLVTIWMKNDGFYQTMENMISETLSSYYFNVQVPPQNDIILKIMFKYKTKRIHF